MSLFQNLEVREPSGNVEEQGRGEGRAGKRKKKKRRELGTLRSHPFPKVRYKFARGFLPIIREIVREATYTGGHSYSGRERGGLFNSVQFLLRLSRTIRCRTLQNLSWRYTRYYGAPYEIRENPRIHDRQTTLRDFFGITFKYADPLSHKDAHFITGSNAFGKEHKLFLKEITCFEGK